MSYTIKDLERLSGIKAHTIRIWEKRYSFLEPHRSETNIRFYSDGELRKMLNIAFLVQNGYKISKVAVLPSYQITELVEAFNPDNENRQSYIINELVKALISVDEQYFEELIIETMGEVGFKRTFIEIVYPFLEKVGVLWLSNNIVPAQEHFISNLVRQKLIAKIDQLPRNHRSGEPGALLFLNKDELHELGLLFYSYLLQEKGYKVIYLGQMVPVADIESIVNSCKISFGLTSFINPMGIQKMEKYVHKLSKIFDQKKVYVTGLNRYKVTKELPSNIVQINSLEEFVKIDL